VTRIGGESELKLREPVAADDGARRKLIVAIAPAGSTTVVVGPPIRAAIANAGNSPRGVCRRSAASIVDAWARVDARHGRIFFFRRA
jgi:hypothetical protein